MNINVQRINTFLALASGKADYKNQKVYILCVNLKTLK